MAATTRVVGVSSSSLPFLPPKLKSSSSSSSSSSPHRTTINTSSSSSSSSSPHRTTINTSSSPHRTTINTSSSSHRTINASFFWEPNHKRNTYSSSHHQQFTFPLTTNEQPSPNNVTISFLSSISQIPSTQWDACALDATGHHKYNPFLSHAFLSTLELSHSAVQQKGWTPHHMIAKDQSDQILAVVPLYLKTHSYGEFVFDHAWANAYHNYGSSYYPKLQSCVPFTPVTGPRILLRDTCFKDRVFDFILSAIKDLTAMSRLSSFHVTFPSENEWHKFTQKGFLPRIGMQYHWTNRNYKNFDEFLMDMKHNKRKKIRQERKKIAAQNLVMKRLRGYEIKAKHWDSFYTFYRNTTDNKWGTPFLTREFFHEMGSKMGDQVLLIVAEDGGELVGGALNLIGGDTLFGRLWGCQPETYYPFLHFEACYYQAIEAAIELNLKTVEAGAQGEHKIDRGYLPVTTYSCHYLIDEEFSKAIEDFLVRETPQVKMVMKLLHDSGPFKEGIF